MGGGGAPNPIFALGAKILVMSLLMTFEPNYIKQHVSLVLLISLDTHKSFSLIKWRLDFSQKYSIQFNFYEESINSLNKILFHINKPLLDICSQKNNVQCLTGCDDIIRQHKAACLRVTSLLACQDLLWVGTSAGVILTMPLPHVSAQTTKISSTLQVTGRSKCELDTLSHFSRWWWPVQLL